MCRKHPEFSYSAPSDASDVLLRQVPDEEEDEEEEDDDKDDNDDDEEEGDGYSASSCFSAGRLIQRASHEWLRFFGLPRGFTEDIIDESAKCVCHAYISVFLRC
jgi:hypothetical protein